MNPVYIEAVSILGPGLPDWEGSRDIIVGKQAYIDAETPPVSCAYLTPNIKRRTTLHMQIALHAAEQALRHGTTPPSQVELVFASAEGDLGISDEIFTALTKPDKVVSPQKFQNVILNAAIGHLGIILGNTSSATAVSGGEYSFAVGLLQAAVSAAVDQHPVLLVAYDALGPERLDPRKPGTRPLAVAVLLTPAATDASLARITPDVQSSGEETRLPDAGLENLRRSIGSARALPLLAALADNCQQTVHLPYCDKSLLRVEVMPCR